MNTFPKIAESVTYLHPDKICDQISDVLLDEYLRHDPLSRVAIEAVGGHGQLALFGEVSSNYSFDQISIAKKYYKKITGLDIEVISYIANQSREIAQGVDLGGAGDQGIMIGYACSENEDFITQEMYLANQLIKDFHSDGKSQVTIVNNAIDNVIISVQGQTQKQLKQHVLNFHQDLNPKKIFANYTGAFTIGGFEADSGCTGRKIVVDAYGPRVPVGGGAFSGKDPTKVDRSAAYMARWIALRLLKKHSAQEVLVYLGYGIGKVQPVLKKALVDGLATSFKFDCRPRAIIERFDLQKPIYADLARHGHFGRFGKLAWEKID